MRDARFSATDDEEDAHGSCVASKAAGIHVGVSKRSHLIVVKASHSTNDASQAWSWVLDDVIAHQSIFGQRPGRSIIVYARSYPP